jgi:branched-chain amino acid transport system substrate-binding protein
MSWSGAGAISGAMFADPCMDIVKDQVKESGGILGGREVEFVKFDDRSVVAETVAGVTKFASDNSIAAVLYGGTSVAQMVAAAETAESSKTPYFCYMLSFPKDMKLSYTVGVHIDEYTYKMPMMMDLAEKLGAKKIAFLTLEGTDSRDVIAAYTQEAKTRGMTVVYNEFFDPSTVDFSSFLTKIKYADPDVFFFLPYRTDYVTTVLKQIQELGGLGHTQVISPHSAVATAAGKPGSEGVIVWVPWMPGLQNAAGQYLEQSAMKILGKLPNLNIIYFYNATWTAIYAIELAGSTDREAIAKAAHSGNLTWDSPSGRVTVPPDGRASIQGFMVKIQGGKLVPLE